MNAVAVAVTVAVASAMCAYKDGTRFVVFVVVVGCFLFISSQAEIRC